MTNVARKRRGFEVSEQPSPVGRGLRFRLRHASFRSVSLATLLLLVGFGLELGGQQKSGLSGAGPVVKGTPDDPLRDPREAHLRHVKQLTFGGQNAEAYFSYDGQRLIFQSTREPYKCDQIFIMNADGSQQLQITNLGGASFAPYFFPDSRRIIVASNYQSPGTSEFELYAVDRDGSKLEPITFTGGFNAFPQFSPDGKRLVFASNRNAKQPHEVNIFLADWVE